MSIPARACSRKGKGDVAEDKTQSENACLETISDVARSASGTHPGIGDVAMAKRHLRHTKGAIFSPISERDAKTFLKITFRGPPKYGRNETHFENAYLSLIFDVASSASEARATKISYQAKTLKLLTF